MKKLLLIFFILAVSVTSAQTWKAGSIHVLQMSYLKAITRELPNFQPRSVKDDWNWRTNLLITFTDSSGHNIVVNGMVHGPDDHEGLPKDAVLVFVVTPLVPGNYKIIEIDRTDGVHKQKAPYMGLPFAVKVTK